VCTSGSSYTQYNTIQYRTALCALPESAHESPGVFTLEADSHDAAEHLFRVAILTPGRTGNQGQLSVETAQGTLRLGKVREVFR
jgi:hypothetical protein